MTQEDDTFDALGYLSRKMAERLGVENEPRVVRARAFNADRAWVQVDRDLDEAFLRSIGIRP